MSYRSSSVYQETKVLSTSPERLVPILYQHVLVELKRGAMQIQSRDYEGKFESLARASDILSELLASLDHEVGGELATRLAALYGFWIKEIAEGGRSLDVRRLARVAQMVASLLEAWEEAARATEAVGSR
jgi:flagellar protein FliS